MAPATTQAEAEADLFDDIEPLLHNRKRRHPTLGYTSPAKFPWRTGLALSMKKNWQHDAVGLEDEKQREPQVPNFQIHAIYVGTCVDTDAKKEEGPRMGRVSHQSCRVISLAARRG